MSLVQRYYIAAISVYKGVRSRGLRSTLNMIQVALADEKEDRAKGWTTALFLDPRKKGRPGPTLPHANYYQPVRTGPFLQAFRRLEIPDGASFVDVGAGTGKAMLLAAELGFSSIKGVEIVDALCDLAEMHFRTAQKRYPCVKFQLFRGCVLDMPLEDEDQVFFCNDPFSEEVFRPFVEKLKAKKSKVGRPLLLVFKNNNLRNIPSLEALKEEGQFEQFDIRGNLFQVYRLSTPKISAHLSKTRKENSFFLAK